MTISEDWQHVGVERLAPMELSALLQKENFYILDVRPLDFERDATFIRGSFLCPLLFLDARYVELPKDRKIVITDWAMKQSPVAAKFLKKKGCPVLGILKGGIERWKEEGLPVEERNPTNEIGPLGPPKRQ